MAEYGERHMSSLFDFDSSQDLVFAAKTAGKQIISAKHEALTKLGAFLFLAHSDNEFALRCQMFDNDITAIANRRLSTVSDSKEKLVRALHAEWNMRHASCKCASKGDQKNCAECGAPATEHDVRGYLELCASCAGKKSASVDDSLKVSHKNTDEMSGSELQEHLTKIHKFDKDDLDDNASSGISRDLEINARTPGGNVDEANSRIDALMDMEDKDFYQQPEVTKYFQDQHNDEHTNRKLKHKHGYKTGTSVDDSLKGTSSSSDSPLNEAENVAEPVWSKKTRTVESSADSPATTPPSTIDPGTPADAANASTTVPPMNTNSNPDSGHNMNSVPSMTAGIKSAHSSCDCGEETIGNFNGKPSCLPGMGCKTDAQPGACPGCNKSFHGFNACPNGNCQGNSEEDAIMREVQMLRKQLEDLIGNGESLETVKRHDEGHDDWHRSMGQEPCTSEEDCAAKTQEHKSMEHKSSKKKDKKEDHYKYIKKQGDSWVITQKGTGKVLSHHDSKEQAISSFKAMMANKHGSNDNLKRPFTQL